MMKRRLVKLIVLLLVVVLTACGNTKVMDGGESEAAVELSGD